MKIVYKITKCSKNKKCKQKNEYLLSIIFDNECCHPEKEKVSPLLIEKKNTNKKQKIFL